MLRRYNHEKLEEEVEKLGALEQLKERYKWIYAFQSAESLLQWDLETQMPPKAGEYRAYILGKISGFVFSQLVSDEMGKLIEEAEKEAKSEEDKALLRFARIDYDKYKKIPPELWEKFSIETAKAQRAWEEAKEKSDFSVFAPHLSKVLDIVIEMAERLGYEENRYDALLDFFEPGMTTKKLNELIPSLREFLVGAVSKIEKVADVEDVFKKWHFDVEKQRELSKKVLRVMGYDFGAGRMDVSAHPFTTTIGPKDVRVTTRFDVHDLKYSFFSTVHEGGHALYEQGIPDEWRGLPIGDGASMAIHESQSRFWENVIGRSRSFWEFFKPHLEEIFPQFKDVNVDDLWKSANIVERSLIRTEADEVTYNLHIMLRFELEEALVNRKLNVEELPKVWNEKMGEYLGVVPEKDSEGVLQDVHWAHGTFGYFPSYMLGNLYSAQIYFAMRKDLDVDELVRNGQFEKILGWLREKIHSRARTLLPGELIEQVTGEQLDSKYFVNYIKEKYSRIYGVEL